MEIQNEKITLKKIKERLKVICKIVELLYKINKKYFFIVILLAIFNGFIPILILQCTQIMINIIQNNINNGFEVLLIAFVCLIIVSIIQDIFAVLSEYFNGIYQAAIVYKLNEKILDKANKLSLEEFEDAKTYDKVTRAKDEVGSTPYKIFSSILTLVSCFVTFISSLGILMYWKSWIIILLIISPIVSSYSYVKLGNLQYKIVRKRANRTRKAWYYSFLSTSDLGAKEIRLYNLGDYFSQKYKSINTRFYEEDKVIAKKIGKLNLGFRLVSQLLSDIAVFIVLRAAFLSEILIGNTVSYIRAISMVQGNAEALLNTTFGLYNSSLYANQLFEFLDMKEEKFKGNIKIDKIENIEFKNVSFKYPLSDKFVLDNISFKFEKNTKVALVGENGCGKSTLVKLITRLYKPISGQILINGININDIDIESIKSKIGAVFQDFNKYELTANENIYLGDVLRKDNSQEIIDAAKKSSIYKYINLLPKKFNTQLGIWFEGGTQLSGGQWQKIALARAFFRKSDLYVLDEPSSFLDPKAENDLFNKLRILTENKMAIFVTHRLTNVFCADIILVINEGKIIEVGTMKELMKAKGKFYEMYTLQNGEKMAI